MSDTVTESQIMRATLSVQHLADRVRAAEGLAAAVARLIGDGEMKAGANQVDGLKLLQVRKALADYEGSK